ncbi:MAG: zinc-binding dehydrogenase [Planctomycetales bacterium]|nr:zinc-binding dehydrogenase [Planctomycetales bacterium]
MPRAAVINEPHQPIEVVDLPAAPMEPGSVLLETLYSEVCGTDVHLWHGRLAGVPYPIIPGHVSVGRVAELAGTVRYATGREVVVGDVVTFLDVHETCQHCWYCLVAKASTRCPSRKVYGITYSSQQGLLGGWAEQIYLKPGVKIIPLPAEMPPERFIAAGCALPTSLHAIDRADVRLGDTVVVQGAGPVGLNAALLASFSGAGRVIVVDRNPQRLDVARRMGLDDVVTLDESADGDEVPGHVVQVMEWTGGRGADVTIEATGAPSAVCDGFRLTRDGGRYVIVGHYTDTGTVPVNPHLDINQKHLEIRGVWGSDFSHFHRSVQLVDRFNDRIPNGGWEQLISGRYALSDMNEALAEVAAGRSVKLLVEPHRSQ